MFRLYKLYCIYASNMASGAKSCRDWCLCEKLPRALLHIPLSPTLRCEVCGLPRRPSVLGTSSEEDVPEKVYPIHKNRKNPDVRVKVAVKAKKPRAKGSSCTNCGKLVVDAGIDNQKAAEDKVYCGRHGFYPKPKKLPPKPKEPPKPEHRASRQKVEASAPPPSSPSPPGSSSSDLPEDMPPLAVMAHQMFNRPNHMRRRYPFGYRNFLVSDMIPLNGPITNSSGGAISKKSSYHSARPPSSYSSGSLPPLSKVLAEIKAATEEEKAREKGGGLVAPEPDPPNPQATQFCPFDEYEGPSEDALVTREAQSFLRRPRSLHMKPLEGVYKNRIGSHDFEPRVRSGTTPLPSPRKQPLDENSDTVMCDLNLKSSSSSSSNKISSVSSDSSANSILAKCFTFANVADEGKPNDNNDQQPMKRASDGYNIFDKLFWATDTSDEDQDMPEVPQNLGRQQMDDLNDMMNSLSSDEGPGIATSVNELSNKAKTDAEYPEVCSIKPSRERDLSNEGRSSENRIGHSSQGLARQKPHNCGKCGLRRMPATPASFGPMPEENRKDKESDSSLTPKNSSSNSGIQEKVSLISRIGSFLKQTVNCFRREVTVKDMVEVNENKNEERGSLELIWKNSRSCKFHSSSLTSDLEKSSRSCKLHSSALTSDLEKVDSSHKSKGLCKKQCSLHSVPKIPHQLTTSKSFNPICKSSSTVKSDEKAKSSEKPIHPKVCPLHCKRPQNISTSTSNTNLQNKALNQSPPNILNVASNSTVKSDEKAKSSEKLIHPKVCPLHCKKPQNISTSNTNLQNKALNQSPSKISNVVWESAKTKIPSSSTVKSDEKAKSSENLIHPKVCPLHCKRPQNNSTSNNTNIQNKALNQSPPKISNVVWESAKTKIPSSFTRAVSLKHLPIPSQEVSNSNGKMCSNNTAMKMPLKLDREHATSDREAKSDSEVKAKICPLHPNRRHNSRTSSKADLHPNPPGFAQVQSKDNIASNSAKSIPVHHQHVSNNASNLLSNKKANSSETEIKPQVEKMDTVITGLSLDTPVSNGQVVSTVSNKTKDDIAPEIVCHARKKLIRPIPFKAPPRFITPKQRKKVSKISSGQASYDNTKKCLKHPPGKTESRQPGEASIINQQYPPVVEPNVSLVTVMENNKKTNSKIIEKEVKPYEMDIQNSSGDSAKKDKVKLFEQDDRNSAGAAKTKEEPFDPASICVKLPKPQVATYIEREMGISQLTDPQPMENTFVELPKIGMTHGTDHPSVITLLEPQFPAHPQESTMVETSKTGIPKVPDYPPVNTILDPQFPAHPNENTMVEPPTTGIPKGPDHPPVNTTLNPQFPAHFEFRLPDIDPSELKLQSSVQNSTETNIPNDTSSPPRTSTSSTEETLKYRKIKYEELEVSYTMQNKKTVVRQNQIQQEDIFSSSNANSNTTTSQTDKDIEEILAKQRNKPIKLITDLNSESSSSDGYWKSAKKPSRKSINDTTVLGREIKKRIDVCLQRKIKRMMARPIILTDLSESCSSSGSKETLPGTSRKTEEKPTKKSDKDKDKDKETTKPFDDFTQRSLLEAWGRFYLVRPDNAGPSSSARPSHPIADQPSSSDSESRYASMEEPLDSGPTVVQNQTVYEGLPPLNWEAVSLGPRKIEVIDSIDEYICPVSNCNIRFSLESLSSHYDLNHRQEHGGQENYHRMVEGVPKQFWCDTDRLVQGTSFVSLLFYNSLTPKPECAAYPLRDLPMVMFVYKVTSIGYLFWLVTMAPGHELIVQLTVFDAAEMVGRTRVITPRLLSEDQDPRGFDLDMHDHLLLKLPPNKQRKLEVNLVVTPKE